MMNKHEIKRGKTPRYYGNREIEHTDTLGRRDKVKNELEP